MIKRAGYQSSDKDVIAITNLMNITWVAVFLLRSMKVERHLMIGFL